jgi:hypothetical protein
MGFEPAGSGQFGRWGMERDHDYFDVDVGEKKRSKKSKRFDSQEKGRKKLRDGNRPGPVSGARKRRIEFEEEKFMGEYEVSDYLDDDDDLLDDEIDLLDDEDDLLDDEDLDELDFDDRNL